MKIFLGSISDHHAFPRFPGNAVTRLSSSTPLQGVLQRNPRIKHDHELVLAECRSMGHTVYGHAAIDPLLSESSAQKHCSLSDVIVLVIGASTIEVGVLVGLALQFQKPVVVLYRLGEITLPESLVYSDKEQLQVIGYDDAKLKKVMVQALEYAGDSIGVRFHLSISAEMHRFLSWITKVKRVPRSVFVRDLIEQAMLAEDGYKK